MIDIIQQSTPKARQVYNCDACLWLITSGIVDGCDTGLTFTELRAIAIAKRNDWKILQGQTYIRQFNCDPSNGETWTYRAIPEIHAINIKHDMYDNL